MTMIYETTCCRLPDTASACPAWCVTGGHLPRELTRGGFHHDGPDETLIFAADSHTEHVASAWHVKASQYVADDDARTASAPQVEIQDDSHVVAVLTPADALQLAAMLVEAAGTAAPQAAADWQDRRAAASVGRTLDEAARRWPSLFSARS